MMKKTIVILFVHLLCGTVLISFTTGFEEEREFCQWEGMNITCPSNHVILITRALYGRMRTNRCTSPASYGHLGCQRDVMTVVHAECTGKVACEYGLGTLHSDFNSCPTGLMAYILVRYRCVPVIPCTNAFCNAALPPPSIPLPEGYIPYTPVPAGPCGLRSCPYTLHATAGRTLNISALLMTGPELGNEICRTYAVVYEGTSATELKSCGRKYSQQEVVYQSASYRIRVEILSNIVDSNFRFLLKYQEIGCADIEAPPFSELHRDDASSLTVTCLGKTQKWHLTCDGSKWIGRTGQCPEVDGLVAESGKVTSQQAGGASTLGVLVIVALGVALGVAVGVFLLCLLVICMKRRGNHNHSTAHPPLPYSEGVYESSQFHKTAGSNILPPYPGDLPPVTLWTGELGHDYHSTLHPAMRCLRQNDPTYLGARGDNLIDYGKADSINGSSLTALSGYREHIYEQPGTVKSRLPDQHGLTDSPTHQVRLDLADISPDGENRRTT